MPKKSSGRPRPELNRRQLSKADKDRRTRQALVLGTAAILGLVVLILGWGVYDQYVRLPSKPVATVGDRAIRLDTYQKLIQYRRWDYRNYLDRLEGQKQQYSAGGEEQAFMVQYIDQQIVQVQQQFLSLPSAVLDELIDDQIARQEATTRGITVNPEDVEAELEKQFGYDRNPPTSVPTPITSTLPITVTPTPTTAPMTLEEFTQQTEEWFQYLSESASASEADFRFLLESSVYRDRVSEALGAEAPITGEQVRARHILVATREEAEQLLQRLASGEAFEALAAELSLDESNKNEGGDLGWFGEGQMVPEFEEVAFSLQPSETSGAVETQFGFHIIRVEERDANHPLEESALSQAQNQYVEDWFEQRRASPDVVRSFDSTMVPTEVPTRVTRRR